MSVGESTEIQINFNCPSLFYFTGEPITGYISFQNAQDKLTLNTIFLEFISEMGYVTQESRQYYDSNISHIYTANSMWQCLAIHHIIDFELQ